MKRSSLLLLFFIVFTQFIPVFAEETGKHESFSCGDFSFETEYCASPLLIMQGKESDRLSSLLLDKHVLVCKNEPPAIFDYSLSAVVNASGTSLAVLKLIHCTSDAYFDNNIMQINDPISCSSPNIRNSIIKTDRGDAETVSILISDFPIIKIEASFSEIVSGTILSKNSDDSIVLSDSFIPNKPGICFIHVFDSSSAGIAAAMISDTEPPIISYKDYSGYIGKPVEAAQLITSVDDFSNYTIYYGYEPDWSLSGKQNAEVIIEDIYGNKTAASVSVSLKEDRTKPALSGVRKIYMYTDDTIRFLDGVSAYDNCDGEVSVDVDTSAVNTHVPGKYDVVYSAKDSAGNTTTKKTVIYITEPKYSDDDVHKLAQEVANSIFTDEMTRTEKLKAAFDWVQHHVSYGSDCGHSDWRKAAVIAFTKHYGDCYGFYAVSRALLDEIGVDYISIERLGGHTRHYWTLVNVGTGWYHYDTTIASKHKYRCFMWTDKQCKVKNYFWKYDKSAYPEVAKNKFDYAAIVQREKNGEI